MCSLTKECVLLLCHTIFFESGVRLERVVLLLDFFSDYRMCSLTIDCVLLLKNVFSYYRMCSLTLQVLVRECTP